ncbi:hypothetical protein F0415_08905 [Arenimonas fontis]|uniref:Toxin CptA n=1 Tax=Arenimonas fontis TaxID=2608255 RepID=A0A5B2ZBJ6_9GAMM|nr:hypothetical protein F0415_08905 [Arenimonas fontis]
MAALAPWRSALPWPGAAAVSVAVSALGARLWRQERRKPACELLFDGGRWWLVPARGRIVPLARAVWHLRGPFAWLRAEDCLGRRWFLAWMPDNLPAPARRELRLAVSAAAAPGPLPLVAP